MIYFEYMEILIKYEYRVNTTLRVDPLSEIFLESKDTGMNLFHFRDLGIIANFDKELGRENQIYGGTRSRGG